MSKERLYLYNTTLRARSRAAAAPASTINSGLEPSRMQQEPTP